MMRATAAPLAADTMQRTVDGDAGSRRRNRTRNVDKAAEAPFRLARRLLDSIGLGHVGNGNVRRRVLLFAGNPVFANGKWCKGHMAAPAKQLLAGMARRFKTFVIDEYLTSQLCPFCAHWLKKTRGRSVRHFRCENDASKREHNKDYLAAFSMLQLGLALLLGERLDPWQRKNDDDDDDAAAATTATASSSSSTTAAASKDQDQPNAKKLKSEQKAKSEQKPKSEQTPKPKRKRGGDDDEYTPSS